MSTRFSKADYKRLEDRAVIERRDVSQLVRAIVLDYLDKCDREDRKQSK